MWSIDNQKKEEIVMNEERQKLMKEIMRIDPVIKKAEKKLRELSSDSEIVEQ